jgi:hypothetical protein
MKRAWVKDGLIVLFVFLSPLLLLGFLIDFPHVLEIATETEPMDERQPGLLGVCLRILGYGIAVVALPIILLIGVFQILFCPTSDNDPRN